MGAETIIPAAITAGANLIGGDATNSASSDNANAQMSFQERMANTQYQRGVKDLEAAGLNPILAAAHPDASPSGAMAPVVNSLSNAMNAGVTTFSAGQAARQTEASVDNTRSSTLLNSMMMMKAAADTNSAMADANYTRAQTDKIRAGSFASDIVGSDAAFKGSQYVNSAISSIPDKMKHLVDSVVVNSGGAVDRLNKFIMGDKYTTSKPWESSSPADTPNFGNPDVSGGLHVPVQ